jgi:hypothetical protein
VNTVYRLLRHPSLTDFSIVSDLGVKVFKTNMHVEPEIGHANLPYSPH